MDLKTKHMIDKNRMGLLATQIIAGGVLAIALLAILGGQTNANVIFRAVMCVVIMLANVVGHKYLRYSTKYIHFCCISMIIVFAGSLWSCNEPSMYALLFSITILVMLFQDMRLLSFGALIAIIVYVIANIKWIIQGVTTPNEVVISSIYAVGAAAMAIVVVRRQVIHVNESLGAVQEGAEAQAKISEEIVNLAEQLNQRFIEAQEVSDTLNQTMADSHNAMSEIAESTKTTAEAVEKQTSQTSDIQENIQMVDQEAKDMGGISVRVGNSVDEGVMLINKLKEQSTQVAKINTETKATTEALNESIKDVQAITETILGISSQTNLLALNASIEAARAGEAGKGFAVVADEIRTLSEGTRQATEQISAIIQRLTHDAQIAANSMMQSAEYAQKQNELISETGEKLETIKDETDELNNKVKEVSNSVQTVLSANTMIMDSISNLSATSEEVSASTETVMTVSNASMDALTNMNHLLEDIKTISTNMESVAKK